MREEQFHGVFFVGENKYLLSRTSCICRLSQDNILRLKFVALMVNKWFDRFITFCILANSILLASQEYDENYNAKYESKWNNTLDLIDIFFTVIFLIECIVKVIAMGFIMHRNSYLRDPWNILDFFIVGVSVFSLLPNQDQSALKALRTARILRPLRSMN